MSFAPSQQVPQQQQQMYYVSPNMVAQPSTLVTAAPGGYITCIGCGVTKAFADTHEGNVKRSC